MKNAPCCAPTSGVSSDMISRETVSRSRSPWSMPVKRAMFEFSQSCSVVDARRLGEVLDHLVDRVLQLRDLALGLDRDRARQVALRHRLRHLGDRTQLRRQRAGELVHVVREALPHAGDAFDLRLDAEASLRCPPPSRRASPRRRRSRAGRPSC